jgi:hypothetical protein
MNRFPKTLGSPNGLAILLVAILPLACGGDHHESVFSPVRELHDQCFGGTDCSMSSVRACLDLDTSNLPSMNQGRSAILLRGRAPHRTDWRDFIPLDFDGVLPAEVDPGAKFQSGWKVSVRGARIEYCQTCYTNSGLAELISLRAPLDSLRFIYDPADTVRLFVEVFQTAPPSKMER